MTNLTEQELKSLITKTLEKEREEKDVLDINTVGEISLIYDKVVIRSGEIVFNPFSRNIDTPKALTWLLKNLNEVEKLVSYWLREYSGRNSSSDVDDCIGVAIDYFTDPDKDFKQNYHSSTDNRKYTIDVYCKSQLKFIVRTYLRKNKYRSKERTLITQEEFNYGSKGVIADTLLVAEFEETDKETIDELFEDSEYHLYDVIFQDLYSHSEYFNQFNYKEFDVKSFIYYMFLDILDTENSLEHLEYVAKSMDEPYQLIFELVKDLRISFKNNNMLAIKLVEDITTLVEGKKVGWKLPNLNEERGY